MREDKDEERAARQRRIQSELQQEQATFNQMVKTAPKAVFGGGSAPAKKRMRRRE